MPSLVAPLRHNRALRHMLLAHFASNFGDWLAFIAVFELTALRWHASIGGMALLTASYLLPFALIAPLAGVFVDRWELRRVLVGSDVLRAGIVCGMLFADRLGVLCLLVFLHQAVSTFFNPAQHAALPRLVRRDEILTANALSTQASHVTKVLGPGIAGVLVATLGTHGCLLLDAATFLLSGALLTRLPRLQPARTTTAPRVPARALQEIAQELRVALDWLRHQPRLRWTLICLVCSIGGLGAFLVTLPIHARDALGLGPRGMGLLLSALGIGTVAGAWGVVRHGTWDRLQTIGVGSLVLCVGLLALARVPQAATAAAVVLLLGCGTAILLVPAHALFQEETPEALRGRVISVALSILALSQVGGMALATWMGRLPGADAALSAAAVLCAAGALLLPIGRRQVRRATQEPAIESVTSPAGLATHGRDPG